MTLALALVAAGVVGVAVWLVRREPTRGQAGTLSAPRLVRLTWDMKSSGASIAPDGDSFAYVRIPESPDEKVDIFVRRVGGENPVNLTKGSGSDNRSPAFSPDGQTIAFRSERDGGGIFLMGATGESVRRLTTFGVSPRGLRTAVRSRSRRCIRRVGRSTPSAPSGSWTSRPARRARSSRGTPSGRSGLRQASGSDSTRRKGMAGGRALLTVPVTGGAPTEIASPPGIGWMAGVWTPGWMWFTNPVNGPPNLWRVAVDEDTGRT